MPGITGNGITDAMPEQRPSRELSPDQLARIRRWEFWNQLYLAVAFILLAAVIVFGDTLGLGGAHWPRAGLVMALLIAPIGLMQLLLRCPACGRYPGWEARITAPARCRHCGVRLHEGEE